MTNELDDLKPREIVEELDKYIIGQNKAKRAVAIALRNRMRRRKLPDDLQDEIAPKNIIMIGPTGVGKTEIARRLSRLCGAPFIKVEATKYTEVGYVGRDVESMVRDLMSVAISMVKSELSEEVREDAEVRAEEALLDLLLPGTGKPDEKSGPVNLFSKFTGPSTGMSGGASADADTGNGANRTGAGTGGSVPATRPPAAAGGVGSPRSESGESDKEGAAQTGSPTREKFRKMLREGALDEKMVEVNVSSGGGFPAIEIFSGTGIEELDVNFGGLSGLFGGKKKKKRVTVKQAKEILLDEEMDKLVDTERVSEIARKRVEEMGIIFIDEIDKVAAKEGRTGGDVSREGVQRDILPIVEGSQVNTRYGMIDTAHILFIAAGAFHMSKPSDLIPELQGRFPIRVELDDLNAEDFRLILTQPQNALITQYVELLKTEGVELSFTDEAVTRISQIAAEVNSKTENIGARRLHTIMEMVLEEVSFTAPEITGQAVSITPKYIDDRLQDVVQDQDLSRYIL